MNIYKNICMSALLCLLSHCGESYSVSPAFTATETDTNNEPWFTGPLLTPSARIVPPDHLALENYFTWSINTGVYDQHWDVISAPHVNQFSPLLLIKYGIFENVAFSSFLQSSYNWINETTSSGFGDLNTGLEFQVINNENEKMPVKFNIGVTFPTGRYQRLNPELNGLDAIGQGAYGINMGLTTSKLFHFEDHRYLNLRVNASTLIKVPFSIKGLNAYGGDPSTYGKIFPGTSGYLFVGFEYTLNRNWVLAFDLEGQYTAKTRFKGHSIVPIKPPLSIGITAAPAIEYNWNSSLAIIFGGIFSIAGKNTAQVAACSFAINIYY